MADAQESEQVPDATAPTTCLPCRGTGTVISYLGGGPTSVPCPWCEGTGVRHPGLDAQARWQQQSDDPAAAAAPSATGSPTS